MAAQEKIIMFCLHPNTTHVLQLLDSTCFSSLKDNCRRVCKNYTAATGCAVTKAEFSQLFCKAWKKSMTLSNIATSFEQTGIYPFNPYAVYIPGDMVMTPPPKKTLAEETGMAYIPLISPAPTHNHQALPRGQTSESSRTSLPVTALVLSSMNSIQSQFQSGLQTELLKSQITLPPLQCSQTQVSWMTTATETETFSDAENPLFSIRYEEGYDINDERYNKWLRKTHPEVCITVRQRVNPAMESLRATFHPQPLRNAVTQILHLPTVTSKDNATLARHKPTVLTAADTIKDLERKSRRRKP